MRDASQFHFREFHIRQDMLDALRRYVEDGTPPGGFLRAILANDLMGACAYADDDNMRNLPAYAAYVYNELPSGCHGSHEIVTRWIHAHAAA